MEGSGLHSPFASAWQHTCTPISRVLRQAQGSSPPLPPTCPGIPSLQPGAYRDLPACGSLPVHIPTHLTPPLDGLLKPPPVSTTPTKGLCLGLWQHFLGICPRAGLPPAIRKGVPLPGISTKAGARYLKPSSVPGPEQALALRMTILRREEPVLPLGMLLTLPSLLHMSCLQRTASISPLPLHPTTLPLLAPICHPGGYLPPLPFLL